MSASELKNQKLLETIKAEAKCFYDKLITENPVLLTPDWQADWNFEEFCDEIRLSLPEKQSTIKTVIDKP